MPIIFTPGFNLGPSPQGPTKLHDMTYQVQDHITIPHGRHEWKLFGLTNCGKGQPGQSAHVSHGAAPARFLNVQIGVRA